jgi:hypothetical protein
MKKTILTFSVVLAIAFSGCGGSDNETAKTIDDDFSTVTIFLDKCGSSGEEEICTECVDYNFDEDFSFVMDDGIDTTGVELWFYKTNDPSNVLARMTEEGQSSVIFLEANTDYKLCLMNSSDTAYNIQLTWSDMDSYNTQASGTDMQSSAQNNAGNKVLNIDDILRYADIAEKLTDTVEYSTYLGNNGNGQSMVATVGSNITGPAGQIGLYIRTFDINRNALVRASNMLFVSEGFGNPTDDQKVTYLGKDTNGLAVLLVLFSKDDVATDSDIHARIVKIDTKAETVVGDIKAYIVSPQPGGINEFDFILCDATYLGTNNHGKATVMMLSTFYEVIELVIERMNIRTHFLTIDKNTGHLDRIDGQLTTGPDQSAAITFIGNDSRNMAITFEAHANEGEDDKLFGHKLFYNRDNGNTEAKIDLGQLTPQSSANPSLAYMGDRDSDNKSAVMETHSPAGFNYANIFLLDRDLVPHHDRTDLSVDGNNGVSSVTYVGHNLQNQPVVLSHNLSPKDRLATYLPTTTLPSTLIQLYGN